MNGWYYRVCLEEAPDYPIESAFYWFFDEPEEAVKFAKLIARDDGAYAKNVRIEFVKEEDGE